MNRITINAVIDNIVYSNPDNGYLICEVDSKEEGQFYAVGTMPGVTGGENVELIGDWVTHPEYGEQFRVELYKILMPTDMQAMIKYLGSGMIKGVREATAKKLVEAFGKDVFDIIGTEPSKLAEVKGISLEKARIISASYNEQRAVQNIIMFLQQYGISPHLAVKIHELLGAGAVDRIRKNPYILATAVDGVSFRTADGIASGMGLPKNSPTRIKCGILYILREAAYTNGHMYLPRGLLIEHTAYELAVSDAEAVSALNELTAERSVVMDNKENADVCYLAGLYHDEKYIAARLTEAAATDVKYKMDPSDAEDAIDELEAAEDIHLAPAQRDAVVSALSGGCMVLTGGPGTGKTTTINAIIKLMERLRLKLALAAPTGRAAKRMSQVTGRESKTIHRLLGAQMSGGVHVFAHDEDDPLPADVIILDEVSMVDTQLMASFLRAVKHGARVIFSGDSDQLPSVGAGNVLHDIIESGVIPVIKLTQIFRQSSESLIIMNAHAINRGDMPELSDHTKDFFFMHRRTPEASAQTIAGLYRERLPASYKISAIKDIQVISPTKKGYAGTVELNRLLQSAVNPPAEGRAEYKYGKHIFREGDKVMQIRNNYDIGYTDREGRKGTGIYNGDMGIIESIHTGDKYMLITFDEDKTIEYPFVNMDELDLAYAITVHKSQGSEFPYVIIPVCSYIPQLMSRNLLYTAITRARTMVILVGSEKTVVNMTNNNSFTKRFTGLCERLTELKDNNAKRCR